MHWEIWFWSDEFEEWIHILDARNKGVAVVTLHALESVTTKRFEIRHKDERKS